MRKIILGLLVMVCIDCTMQKQLELNCNNDNCNLTINFQDYEKENYYARNPKNKIY